MVYYFTSRNVKLIQSLMQDYRALTEITPHEYIPAFESRLQNMGEQKVKWIIEVFLGVNKHGTFLKNITREAGSLSDLEADYFVIIAYGILFQISPKNTLNIFKCVFNLSKRLLNTFIMFFKSKDNVATISEIAEKDYDKYFVTENILGPVLSWQPFLFQISKAYNKYLNEAQNFYQESLTLLANQNELNNTENKRKNQGHIYIAPNVTPKAIFFTNTKIRQHNREKSKKVLKHYNMKNKTNHYCYYMEIKKKNSKFKDPCTSLAYRNINVSTSIKKASVYKTKTTKSVVKRLNNTVKKYEQNELKWLHDIIDNCENSSKVEKLLEYDQQEKKKERLLNMKKNHLLGQISHEHAYIAKQNVYRENRRKYNEFTKEKELWEKEIECWKLKQTEYNRKQVEKMSLIELNLLNSKNSLIEKRKEIAETVRYDTKLLRKLILLNKEADLERRINIIKEIKTLSTFAKNSRMQKTVNFNQSPGFGFLCEMTIAELQNKLAAMKISIQEELDEKKNKIKTLNLQNKQELEATKKLNDTFLSERGRIRNLKKTSINIDISASNEISNLEKILQKRRNQRILLTKQKGF